MAAVTVDTLEKSFGSVRALNGLGFSVDKGAMFGLIGPDGAGKSTFMRIAACLLLQDSGSVVIGGHNTRKESGAVKASIGYMPQRFSLYPDLSVRENLVFFADLFGIGKKQRERRIGELMEFSRLGKFLKRRAGDLSGGMKQKLALSCTLIHTPEVLFLDEPTTGVDPVSRREFWGLLADIRREGAAIIVSTPYMDEAEKCDHVGFIMNGRLIMEGEPSSFPDRFSCQILEVRGVNLVRRSREFTFPPVVKDVKTFGDRLHLTVDDAAVAREPVLSFLNAQGIEQASADRVPPSMEDVFVENMSHA